MCGSCHKTYHARCESPGEAVTILEAASQTCNRCAEADDVGNGKCLGSYQETLIIVNFRNNSHSQFSETEAVVAITRPLFYVLLKKSQDTFQL